MEITLKDLLEAEQAHCRDLIKKAKHRLFVDLTPEKTTDYELFHAVIWLAEKHLNNINRKLYLLNKKENSKK